MFPSTASNCDYQVDGGVTNGETDRVRLFVWGNRVAHAMAFLTLLCDSF